MSLGLVQLTCITTIVVVCYFHSILISIRGLLLLKKKKKKLLSILDHFGVDYCTHLHIQDKSFKVSTNIATQSQQYKMKSLFTKFPLSL